METTIDPDKLLDSDQPMKYSLERNLY